MWGWMVKNAFCETGAWFWTMAQFFAIVISLVFIYRQVRAQNQANLLQTLASLDNRWNSADMLASRKRACENYLKDELKIKREQSDVIGFFEDIGIYLERKVFDDVALWDKYSYYVEHYWAMYQPHIMEFRAGTKDPTWYDKFEMLKNRMEKVSKRKGLKIVGKTQDEIKKFIATEID